MQQESPSFPCHESKKLETKIESTYAAGHQKHDGVCSYMCGFNRISESQAAEKCDSTIIADLPSVKVKEPKIISKSKKNYKYECSKMACSPSFELRELSAIMSPLKENKLGESRREDSSSFEVKKETSPAPCNQTQDYNDSEMVAEHQYQLTALKLKEPRVSFQKSNYYEDVSRADLCFREFKRLKERIFELDNERAALTEAIGNEIGLTTNMQKLHEYNTIKDIAQIVIGCLSNLLDVPVTQLHQDLNLTFQE
jgi:hypothetical protein